MGCLASSMRSRSSRPRRSSGSRSSREWQRPSKTPRRSLSASSGSSRGGPCGDTIRPRSGSTSTKNTRETCTSAGNSPGTMRSEVGTSRVEAFSDGVFAIALTLLILEIRVPHATPDHTLWAGLVALWPSYVAFVLSFFVVLVMWVNHHELMRLAGRTVSYPFLFANGLLLLSVTFVPFPTAILAQYLATADAKVAVAFYCGSFLVNSLAWNDPQ